MTTGRPGPGTAPLALFLTGLALAGCATAGAPTTAPPSTGSSAAASGAPAPGTGTPATPPPAPSPSPSPGTGDELAPDGLGPYAVGARLNDLRDAGLVAGEQGSTGCPDYVVARGTSRFHEPALVFYQGRLLYVSVDTPLIRTTGGARVAMPLSAVQARYPTGVGLSDGLGGTALLVTDGANALLFRVSPAGTIDAIEAGPADTLEFRFTDGEGC